MLENKVYLLEGKGQDKSLERSVSVEQGIEVNASASKIIPLEFHIMNSDFWFNIIRIGKNLTSKEIT